ncbi:chloramphenicol phosphotransferase [Actinoplanes italicus]|uniref:chloramphenicol phosphotransferase CPT family protein n=1 Tax=Actinoplanes italicus TaxID=113567 RepID=UPI00147516A6|nr:AAA family ATPase [Actinoplanes italicus]GIE28294.1 chloramphenicol phosphotransferase [Actinoplanes italicus]
MTGRVVLLNGASSSGKTSVGRALLGLLADPWFFFPVDGLGEMRSTVHTRVLGDAEIAAMLVRTRRGYHRAVAGLASAGNDVVMDYPLSERWRLADLLVVLAGFEVTLVEVRCSPAELDRRERARGDRPVGLARSQTLVYEIGDRDVVVDTTMSSPQQCARVIAGVLERLAGARAFDRLRASGGWQVQDPAVVVGEVGDGQR